MSSDANSTPCISPNTDISGVGVRVALYSSMTIGLLLMRFWTRDPESFRDAARTSFITSVALIVSAIVSWQTGAGGNNLDLFDAFIVTTMTSLVVMYTFVVGAQAQPTGAFNKGNLESHGKETSFQDSISIPLLLATLFHTVLWVAFGIIVWRDPANFSGGPPSGCAPARFWIFGYTPFATDQSLRAFALFAFAAGGIVSLVLIVYGVVANILARRFLKTKASQDQVAGLASARATNTNLPAITANGQSTPASPVGQGTAPNSPVAGPSQGPHTYPPTTPTVTFSSNVPPTATHAATGTVQRQGTASTAGTHPQGEGKESEKWPVYIFNNAILIIGVASWLYLIITTEMIITINQQREQTNTLTFGQILSIVLLLDQVVFQTMTQSYNTLWEHAQTHPQAANAVSTP